MDSICTTSRHPVRRALALDAVPSFDCRPSALRGRSELALRLQRESILNRSLAQRLAGMELQAAAARQEVEEIEACFHAERKELEDQLRQAQRMEALGQLAGGVAHDFNNILHVILGYAEMLQERGDFDAGTLEALGEIHGAGDRAVALVRQLLAFSRKQLLRPEVLDLNQAIENLGKMLRRLIGEDVEFRTDFAPDLARVRIDPGQLEQVVLNLVVNARDAMPQGGVLHLRTAMCPASDGTFWADPGPPRGRRVVLTATDSGCGMDEATRQRIFEPYFTTKAEGKGTGLGLATVYGIVKQSGGQIEAESQPDQGTTVRIYLPAVEAGAARPPADEARTRPAEGSETILVVEDDPHVRAITRQVLEAAGYRVLDASNAAAACEVARKHPGALHLVLTDVVMPGASGPALAEQLAGTRREAKVLYMSGYVDDAVTRHGVTMSSMPFLEKPFSTAVLALKVREVLDGR